MNFIRDVLDIISENEIIDTKQQIEKLTAEVEDCQEKIQSYINDNYCEFIPNFTNNKLLLVKGHHLFAEIENLEQNIQNEGIKKNIQTISADLNSNLEQLKESSIGLQISIEVLKIDNLFQQIEMAQQNDEYIKNMEYLDELRCLIYDSSHSGMLKDLLCYESLKLKFHNYKALFASRIDERFKSLVQMNEKSYQKTKMITLRVTQNGEALNEIMIALFGSKYNISHICQFLLNNIFEPIISKPVSLNINGGSGGGGDCVDRNSSGSAYGDFDVLNLSFGLTTSDELRPNYKLVFDNIKKVIGFLLNLNMQISPDLCVFQLFGEEITEKLLKSIILNCLNRSIPENMDELLVSTLKVDVLEFNDFLCESQLLNGSIDMDLIQFANDIDFLFKNRFYTNIIENAQQIMRQNLHDMSLVDDITNVVDKKQSHNIQNESIITFERCMVSKSALELTNFLDKILKQQSTLNAATTTATEPQNQSQLLDKTLIITAILDRYVDEVAQFNAKNLLEIPQQAALFYNNCIYLVHWLVENTKNHKNDYSVTIQLLHGQGNEYFQRQVFKQRDHISTILQKFIETKSPTEFDPFWIKIIRQCLRVLEFLKNVWQSVLPARVYKKTIINLCNEFYLEILRRILSIEDIPLPVSNGLVEILENILERTSSIFENELENETFKSTQKKLSLLKMILTVSMAQIVEQWDHGKGDLTNYFKAEEIKHLIRALFQNTDRRAQALATII